MAGGQAKRAKITGAGSKRQEPDTTPLAAVLSTVSLTIITLQELFDKLGQDTVKYLVFLCMATFVSDSELLTSAYLLPAGKLLASWDTRTAAFSGWEFDGQGVEGEELAMLKAVAMAHKTGNQFVVQGAGGVLLLPRVAAVRVNEVTYLVAGNKVVRKVPQDPSTVLDSLKALTDAFVTERYAMHAVGSLARAAYELMDARPKQFDNDSIVAVISANSFTEAANLLKTSKGKASRTFILNVVSAALENTELDQALTLLGSELAPQDFAVCALKTRDIRLPYIPSAMKDLQLSDGNKLPKDLPKLSEVDDESDIVVFEHIPSLKQLLEVKAATDVPVIEATELFIRGGTREKPVLKSVSTRTLKARTLKLIVNGVHPPVLAVQGGTQTGAGSGAAQILEMFE